MGQFLTFTFAPVGLVRELIPVRNSSYKEDHDSKHQKITPSRLRTLNFCLYSTSLLSVPRVWICKFGVSGSKVFGYISLEREVASVLDIITWILVGSTFIRMSSDPDLI